MSGAAVPRQPGEGDGVPSDIGAPGERDPIVEVEVEADVEVEVKVEVEADDGNTGVSHAAYCFDPTTIPDLAKLIDENCATSIRPDKVGDDIRGGSAVRFSEVTPEIAEVSVAFWYRVKLERGETPRPGATLEPLRAGDAPTWPSPIREASAETRLLWSALSEAVTHPTARARFHDLCFSAGIGNGRDHAAAAVDAYLEQEGAGADIHDVIDGLCRAWTLAGKVGYGDGVAKSLAEILRLAQSRLSSTPPLPGLVLPLLEILASIARDPSVEQDPTDQLLRSALDRFPQSYLVARITRLQKRRASDDEQRTEADRTLVEAMLREADDADEPLVRMHFLTEAAAVAKRFGVKDLADQAVRDMQALKDGDLNWITISASSEIPASFAEGYLRQFDEVSDWRTALVGFLTTDSPTGDAERNRRNAQQDGSGSLRRLFANTRFGRHGLPERTAATDDEHDLAGMVEAELMYARFQGRLLAEGLRRIAENFGEPPKDDVAAFLAEAYGCDFDFARSFATALWLFWEGEYEACVHLAVPKVEGALRALLLLLDEPLYRVEEAKKPGQFPGLAPFSAPLGVKPGFE